MKAQNNTAAFQIVAAVTLLISTILLLISGYQSFDLLWMAGVGLLIAGILLANRKLMTIGAFLNFGRAVINLVRWSFVGVSIILPAIMWLLLIIAIHKHNKALILCGIVAAFNIVPDLFSMLKDGWFDLIVIARDMLLVVSFGLLGCALQNGMQSVFVSRPVEAPRTASNQYENLIKLKDLLDSGAITQEEFDQKKKELLEV